MLQKRCNLFFEYVKKKLDIKFRCEKNAPNNTARKNATFTMWGVVVHCADAPQCSTTIATLGSKSVRWMPTRATTNKKNPKGCCIKSLPSLHFACSPGCCQSRRELRPHMYAKGCLGACKQQDACQGGCYKKQ